VHAAAENGFGLTSLLWAGRRRAAGDGADADTLASADGDDPASRRCPPAAAGLPVESRRAARVEPYVRGGRPPAHAPNSGATPRRGSRAPPPWPRNQRPLARATRGGGGGRREKEEYTMLVTLCKSEDTA
jgi:hypothetical protein